MRIIGLEPNATDQYQDIRELIIQWVRGIDPAELARITADPNVMQLAHIDSQIVDAVNKLSSERELHEPLERLVRQLYGLQVRLVLWQCEKVADVVGKKIDPVLVNAVIKALQLKMDALNQILGAKWDGRANREENKGAGDEEHLREDDGARPSGSYAEPRVEPRVEPRIEPRVEPRVEPHAKPRVESNAVDASRPPARESRQHRLELEHARQERAAQAAKQERAVQAAIQERAVQAANQERVAQKAEQKRARSSIWPTVTPTSFVATSGVHALGLDRPPDGNAHKIWVPTNPSKIPMGQGNIVKKGGHTGGSLYSISYAMHKLNYHVLCDTYQTRLWNQRSQ
jgi:hypothetical protein